MLADERALSVWYEVLDERLLDTEDRVRIKVVALTIEDVRRQRLEASSVSP